MTIREMQKRAHDSAVYHGFWESDMDIGTAIALMHSELSEALEEERAGRTAVWNERDGNISDAYAYTGAQKAGVSDIKPEGTLIELADCVIRIMDYCGARDWDLEKAIADKMQYNASRPYKHGKKF